MENTLLRFAAAVNASSVENGIFCVTQLEKLHGTNVTSRHKRRSILREFFMKPKAIKYFASPFRGRIYSVPKVNLAPTKRWRGTDLG